MNIGTLTIEMAANVARLSKDMDATRRMVGKTFGSIEKDIERLKGLLGGLFAGATLGAFTGKLVAVQREFDVLNSSLITVTGSAAKAESELRWIKQFAATTPFQLTQVTGAFVKMKSLGLDASQRALTSYGNTASAMGKDLNQMIEAVADAATGEFERLKEFGIKASKEGNQVALTFQGVTTRIGNSASEITGYLQKIGESQFAGAMATRAATLDGALSNLADTWDELFRTISSSGAGGLIGDAVAVASGAINDLITIIKAASGAATDSAGSFGVLATVQEGLAKVFETVAVLGVNVKYVLFQMGRELGGLAAQAVAFLSGNFAGVAAIHEAMVTEAEAARREVDATTASILGARNAAQELANWNTRNASAANDPRRVDATTRQAAATVAATKATKGLTEAEKERLEIMKLQRANFMAQQDEYEKRLEDERKAMERSAEAAQAAEQAKIDAARGSAASVQQRIDALILEEEATALSEQQNISLAQAIETVTIARLQERQAALMREGDRDSEVLALQAEIDARRKLRDALGSREAREAGKKVREEEAKAYEKHWDQVSQSLVDALMQGGKSAAEYLKGLFRSLVLKPIINAVINPVMGAISGALGLAGTANAATGALSSGFSLASLGTSIASLGSSVMSLGSAFTTGISGLTTGASLANTAALGSAYGTGGSLAATAGYLAGPVAVAAIVANALGLFRSKKIVGSGLQGTLGEGDIRGYDLQRRGGSLFSGPSYSILDKGVSEQSQVLQDAFLAMRAGSAAMAESLGLSSDAVKSFTTTLGKELIHPDTGGMGLKLEGLTAEQVSAKIQQALEEANNEMASLVLGTTEFTRKGETSSQTLMRLSVSLQGVNAVFDTLGETLIAASLAGADMASALVDAFGGMERFTQATSAYYQDFYTADERKATTMRQLTTELDKMGFALPKTRDEYRALVGAQDLTTEAGRKNYATLLALAPAYASVVEVQKQVTTSAEDMAAALLAAQEEAKKAAIAAAEAAYATLERAVDAQRNVIQAQVDAAQEAADAARGVFSTITDAVRQLYKDTASTAAMGARAGAVFIQQALDAARSTGYLPDNAQLGEAIAGVTSGLGNENFKTRVDAERARLQTAAQLRELGSYALDTATTAEQQLTAAKKQIESLDLLLEQAQLQLDALNGVNISVLSVVDAIHAFQAAMVAAGQATGTAPTTGTPTASFGPGSGGFSVGPGGPQSPTQYATTYDQEVANIQAYVGQGRFALVSDLGSYGSLVTGIDSSNAPEEAARYQSIQDYVVQALAQGASAQDLANAAAEYGVTQRDIATAMGYHPTDVRDFFSGAGIPAFAGGGQHAGGWAMVGEQGPELAYMPPAHIYTAPETQQMLSGGTGDVALREELAQMRFELRAVAAHTAKMAKLQDNWDVRGLTVKTDPTMPLEVA